MERAKLKIYDVMVLASSLKVGWRELLRYKKVGTASLSTITNEAIAKAKRLKRSKDEYMLEVRVFKVNELPAGKIKNGTRVKPPYELLSEVHLVPPAGKAKRWTVLKYWKVLN